MTLKSSASMYGEVHHPEKGRSAVATKKIRAGTCVLRTRAYAAIARSACNWCFTSASTTTNVQLFRCGGCRQVKYCTRKCQQLDWQDGNHGKECGAWKQIPKEAAAQVVPTVLLVARIAAKLYLNGGMVDKGEHQEVLQLRHHFDDHPLNKQKQYAEMAQLVLLLLSRSKFNTEQLDFETFAEKWAAQVQLLFGRVNCNAFSISDDMNAPLGIGLFPHGALFNHSCAPNCIVSFMGQEMMVHAIEDLLPGQELTISYVELLESTPKRQLALQQSYFFQCQCDRCETSCADPSREDWYLDGFACLDKKCNSKGVVVAIVESNGRDDTCPCKKCGTERSIAELRHIEQELVSLEKIGNSKNQLTSSDRWINYQRAWILAAQLHPRNTRRATLAREIGNFLMEMKARNFPNIFDNSLKYFMEELHATEWILPRFKFPSRGLLHFQIGKILYEDHRDKFKKDAMEQSIEHLHQALSMYVNIAIVIVLVLTHTMSNDVDLAAHMAAIAQQYRQLSHYLQKSEET